ncbi:MAG TPA: RNA-binding protein [Burkholderiales bacterium]|nr:RNA-binding protein [Burkholderiales bacterium]
MLAIAQEGEPDRGAASAAAKAERTCALTREVRPASELVRFVVGPDGETVPDVKRKLPGRGIWVTATRAAIADATKSNVFARGFRREVHVPGDLAEQTERLLERAALDALAIAGKAGAIVSGFFKVEAALRRDDILALIHAADAADNGKRKLTATLQRNTGGKPGEIAVIDTFIGAQLDLALSRPNVVHAALLAGPGSETFLARAARLTRFRTGFSPDAVSAHAPTDGA